MLSENSIADKLYALETGVNKLTADMEKIAEHQKKLSLNVEKITELLIKQAELKQETQQNSKAIDVLFNTVRGLEQNGTSQCKVHGGELKNCSLKIEMLEKSIAMRDKISISIGLLFASGLVAMFFKMIGGK